MAHEQVLRYFKGSVQARHMSEAVIYRSFDACAEFSARQTNRIFDRRTNFRQTHRKLETRRSRSDTVLCNRAAMCAQEGAINVYKAVRKSFALIWRHIVYCVRSSSVGRPAMAGRQIMPKKDQPIAVQHCCGLHSRLLCPKLVC